MTEIVPVRPLEHNDRAKRLADMFIATRLSTDTKTAYRRDLELWLGWCSTDDVGLDVLTARHAHVQLWLAHLERCGDADATRARRLATLSSWYDWLGREGTVDHNPARLRSGERPKSRRDSPRAHLSPGQLEQLLEAADRDPDPRTAALVALLAYTGARIGEVLGADIEDLGYEREDRVLPITGKGRRSRTLPLEPPVLDRLDRYLSARAATPPTRLPATVGPRGRRPLFLNDRGRRMQRQSARYIIRKVAASAGLPVEVADRLTPHSMRHTYATTLLEEGAPVRDVQYAMGHADPRTTEWYDHSQMSRDRHPSRKLARLLEGRRAEGGSAGTNAP